MPVFRRDVIRCVASAVRGWRSWPRGFWQQVLDSDMAVPDERPLNELTAELVRHARLGQPGRARRDRLSRARHLGRRRRLRRPARHLRRRPCASGLRHRARQPRRRHGLSAQRSAPGCSPNAFAATTSPTCSPSTLSSTGPTGRSAGMSARRTCAAGSTDKGWAHTVALRRRPDRRAGSVAPPAVRSTSASFSTSLPSACWLRARAILTDGEDDRLRRGRSDHPATQPARLQTNSTTGSSGSAGAWFVRAPTTRRTGPPPAPATPRRSCAPSTSTSRSASAPANATLSFDEPPECRADLLLSLLRVVPDLTPWLHIPAATADRTGCRGSLPASSLTP